MKETIYIMGGPHHIGIGKLSAALTMAGHPVVIQSVCMEKEKLNEERKRDIDQQNAEVNKGGVNRIDAKELRMQLGEIALRSKTFHEKPDRIPCPKPYRKSRFK